jgi:hypothetical protein
MADALRHGTTTTRLVLKALRSGAALTARDAARFASETAGRTVHPGTVSGILSRVSDPARCDLGHFIRKGSSGGARVYLLAEEAMTLTEDQLHGLTLRSGSGRYELARALADHPRLRRLIPSADWPSAPPTDIESEPAPPATPERETPKPASAPASESALAPPKEPEPPGAIRDAEPVAEAGENRRRNMEVSFRCGGEDAFSLNTSVPLFWLLCLALVVVAAALALLAYTVLLPLLMVTAAAAGITGTLWFIWRRRKALRQRAGESLRGRHR